MFLQMQRKVRNFSDYLFYLTNLSLRCYIKVFVVKLKISSYFIITFFFYFKLTLGSLNFADQSVSLFFFDIFGGIFIDLYK